MDIYIRPKSLGWSLRWRRTDWAHYITILFIQINIRSPR
jgi:hypothetical protein